MNNDIHVVGAGLHRFGRHPGVSGLDMAEHAIRAALDDAGCSWNDVDLLVGGSNVSGKPDALMPRLGLTGVPVVTVRNGCATGGVALATAANAIRAGEADIVVAVGFDKHERGAFGAHPASYGLGSWYAEAGMLVTTQYFAMKSRRYLHDHDIPVETLAQVSERAFHNGAAHPSAWRRTAISAREVLDADEVNPPLTRYMLCSPGEGATALVLARGDRAADLCARPVRLASVAVRSRPRDSFEVFSPWLSPEPRNSPTIDAARRVIEQAGIDASDIQVAQVQDTDSGSEVIHLAETGLCAHGAQKTLVASGGTAASGQIPINTDGGCLANGEPVGASGLRQVHEIVRQLQGRAEGHQVPGNPSVGFTHVYGAPGVSACAVLIG